MDVWMCGCVDVWMDVWMCGCVDVLQGKIKITSKKMLT